MSSAQSYFEQQVHADLPAQVGGRSWFLLNCEWNDPRWIFKPTNILEEDSPPCFRWDFEVHKGELFTDVTYSLLLESSRQLIATIRASSLSTGLPQRARTTVGYALYLRGLVRWMVQAGYGQFSALDEEALLQFRVHLSKRAGSRRGSLAPTTIQKYLYIFTYLYRFRGELSDGLSYAPFSGQPIGAVAGVRDSEIPRWPYTPEAVAVPLIQRSMELVLSGSTDALRVREIYVQSMQKSSQRGLGLDAATNAAMRSLKSASLLMPVVGRPIRSVRDVCHLINMLYAACFVVLSYLVGARASEILNLTAGCVQKKDVLGRPITLIIGAIYKRQPEYMGRLHEWVAPPAAVKAIEVLEALSEPHRQRSGQKALWLRVPAAIGATEWHQPSLETLRLCSTERIRDSLQRLSEWFDLPKFENKKWTLTTHQGRKTFARFAALRDRSALFALAQQLGHRERAVTDHGYSGSDYRLTDEINAEILEQSVSAWEHMLAEPQLGGRAGAEIVSKRPRFLGVRIKQDIKSYARMLVDAGLTLGVCDWGFCVYRESSSACLGNAVGPNPSRREPSTCSRCANFAVSSKHRPYWSEQVKQSEELLLEPTLPLQTLRIARERLQEAKILIRAIDAASEE